MGELDLGRACRSLRSLAFYGRDLRSEVFLMAEAKYETHEYDVVVIGAGGAGLRAAVESSAQGVKTALVCKSLLGKAHTVMAKAASRPRWATSIPKTIGKCTSATPCAAD